LRFQIPLEVAVRELVSIFKFTIVFTVLLDCIIREMDVLVTEVLKGKLLAARPEIAILIKVATHASILGHHHAIDTNVELAFVYE
jgi:hypothetical protein